MKTETEITNSVLPELSMIAEFVPQSDLTGDPHKWQVKWVCRFSLAGRFGTAFESPYFTGIGYIKGVPQSAKMTVDLVDGLREILRTGKSTGRMPSLGGTSYRLSVQQPTIDGVMYCLVSDSDVLDYGAFEEWADSLGYDTDSREAEKTYRICLEQALKLRSAIGNDKLEQLREAFQDY